MEHERVKIDETAQRLIEANERLSGNLAELGENAEYIASRRATPRDIARMTYEMAGTAIRGLVREHLGIYLRPDSIVRGVDLRVGRGNIYLDPNVGELFDVPRRNRSAGNIEPLPHSAWVENWRGVEANVSTLKIY